MDNPLLAIPQLVPGIETRADARGWVQLRQPRLYSGGLWRWLALQLQWQADAKIQLDDHGSFFWRQIDGRNTLEQIAAAFGAHYDRPAEESRRAVVAFTRDLMRRELISLKIGGVEDRVDPSRLAGTLALQGPGQNGGRGS